VNQRSPSFSHAAAEPSIIRVRTGGMNSAVDDWTGVNISSRSSRDNCPGV